MNTVLARMFRMVTSKENPKAKLAPVHALLPDQM